VDVKGKLKLKLGKKKVATGSYKLDAGETATFNVRLPRAVLRRIAKRGKVKLSLGLTAKGKTGKTFKTTAKLTVKRAKKAKKKKKPVRRPVPYLFDGKYLPVRLAGASLSFTVTDGGRKIVNLTGSQSGSCFIYTPGEGGEFVFGIMYPAITSIDVAADGTFAKTEKLSDTTTEITNGKLENGVATGHIRTKEPYCSGTTDFKSAKQ
jgi:hypothetical protein